MSITVDIPEGMIELDSESGKLLGFTSEQFQHSYLWRKGNEIYISLIEVKKPNNGTFKSLIKCIEELGFQVAVPNPLGQMIFILEKWNFTPIFEQGGSEVWRKR